jgi:hypothetical protein
LGGDNVRGTQKGFSTVLGFYKHETTYIFLKVGSVEVGAFGTLAVAPILALSLIFIFGRWRGLL